MPDPASPAALGGCNPALTPLFGEIGDLKRIRSAGRTGSIATRLFRRAWSELVAGRAASDVAMETTAAALAATRLGDIDAVVLRAAGLGEVSAAKVFSAAVRAVGAELSAGLREALVAAAGQATTAAPASELGFVRALEHQPRAGVTCPGRPRILLEPPENHAEHCLAVAVIGVVLSPTYGARVETVFLAALAHHLHNARLPDSGFTGEMLLGDHLAPVMEHFTEVALLELPLSLQTTVREARAILPDAETPEGRAFHAADTIDRVMQIGQHLKAAQLTMPMLLDDMSLVHEGPVKPFQDRVLAEMGLA